MTAMLSKTAVCATGAAGARRPAVATRASDLNRLPSSQPPSRAPRGAPSSPPPSPVGDKVGRWIQTPFDMLSFGPRVGAGALVSMPDRLQTISGDIERAMELLQDPRPLDEKSEVFLREIEDTMVAFLEKGADVETDVFANIKTVLPTEAANMLTELIPEPPRKFVEPVYPDEEYQEPVMYVKEDVAASQVESEVTEIKKAVLGLKQALEDIRSNTDVSQVSIVKINLREARDMLARRLYEVSPEDTRSPSVAAAVREAGILLDEVNAQFFSN